MNDVSGNSEVKKRKGPSAEYQKARRDAIKAGTWKPRIYEKNDEGNRGTSTDPQSSPVGPSNQS